jgi:dihydrodipicolinate synthase/N-acetylneuraminate lyase
MWRALKEARPTDAQKAHDQLARMLQVVGRYTTAHGRAVFGEVMRLRGLPVRRFPRWECMPFSVQESDELKNGLIKAGISLTLP